MDMKMAVTLVALKALMLVLKKETWLVDWMVS